MKVFLKKFIHKKRVCYACMIRVFADQYFKSSAQIYKPQVHRLNQECQIRLVVGTRRPLRPNFCQAPFFCPVDGLDLANGVHFNPMAKIGPASDSTCTICFFFFCFFFPKIYIISTEHSIKVKICEENISHLDGLVYALIMYE